MEKTSIILYGITIYEPVTAITDLFVTAICFWAYFKLKKLSKQAEYLRLYPWFFLTMGISTLCGALMTHAFYYVFQYRHAVHAANPGFFERIEENWQKLPSWIFNIISVSIFTFCMLYRAGIWLKKNTLRIFYIIATIETIAMLGLMLYTMNFLWSEIHIALCLWCLAIPIQSYINNRERKPETKAVLFAVLTTTLTCAVLIPKISFGVWFNHNDISHIIITFAMYIFYMAGIFWITDARYNNDDDDDEQNIPAAG